MSESVPPTSGGSTTAAGSRAGARRAVHPHRWRRRMIGVLATLLILSGLGYSAYSYFDSNITRIDLKKALGSDRPETVGPKKAMNVLVLGSDTRKGKGNNIGGVTEGLSDTTILLHLSKDRSRAYGVSIPRDAMVRRPMCLSRGGKQVPGGLAMFNEAYKIGGAACTLKQVESITNIRFDHVMVVDFNGFKNMVDALGGVQMCVPKQIDDSVGNIHLRAGTYNMDGKTALDYVRVRHQISANGDIGRMKRQQTFIAAMIKKLVSVGTLANPLKLTGFLDAATKSLTTDQDFDVVKIAGVAKSLKDIGLDRVEFITVPWQAYAPDPNRVELKPEADQLWARIRHDKPLGPQFSSEVVRASDKVPGAKDKTGKTTTKPGKAKTMSPEERARVAAENGLCA